MADAQDQEQKTEQPTGKKLAEARDQGQLPISREVGTWFLFCGILIVLGFMTPMLGENLLRHLRVFIEVPHALRIGDHGLQKLLADTLLNIGLPLLMIFAILLAASVLGTLTQTGFFASTKPLEFSWEKLSPVRGLKNMVSMAALVELGKGILKFGVIGYVAWLALRPYAVGVDLMIGRDFMGVGEALRQEAFSLMLALMIVVSMVAMIDLFYRRHEYYKSLRMTKQEVKDELKQSEGDPLTKMRIRQIRMDKARKRMMASVPKADVVLTNPTHYAVALRYDTEKMNAPTLVAKGVELIALRIREIAEASSVPIVENPPLTRMLYQTVDIDQEIPPQHYRAVAEVISYVYRLRKKKLN